MDGRLAAIWKGSLWLPFLLLLVAPGVAQDDRGLTVTPALDLSYSSNLFLDASQYGDSYWAPGLDLDWEHGALSLFLSAEQRFFRENPDLNSGGVSVGLSVTRLLSPKTTLFISPLFNLDSFRGDYAYLDSFSPSLSMGVKHYFRANLFSRFSLEYAAAGFVNEPAFNHARWAVQAETSLFLKTQTTLRLQAGLNWLRFANGGVAASASPTPASGSTNGPGGHRRLPPSPVGTAAAPFSYALPFVSLRLAQGLGSAVGLVAEYQRRWLGTDLGPLAALTNEEWAMPGLGDTFTWGGDRWLAGIKAPLGPFALAGDAAFLQKSYPGFAGADPAAASSDRRDRLFVAQLQLSRNFGAIGVRLLGEWRRNESNDERFRYRLLAMRVGLDYTF